MARHCGTCGEAGHYQSTCGKQRARQNAPSPTPARSDAAMTASISVDDGMVAAYQPGLWLVNLDTNIIAGRIKRVTKETIVYDSMLGAETESTRRDVVNSNYSPVELYPHHLLKFSVFWSKR